MPPVDPSLPNPPDPHDNQSGKRPDPLAESTPEPAASDLAAQLAALTQQGDDAYAAGDYAQAIPPYRKAVVLADKQTDWYAWTFQAWKLSNALSRADQNVEAEALTRQLLDAHSAPKWVNSEDVLRLTENLAILRFKQGGLIEAEPLFRTVLEARERTNGPDHPETWLVMSHLDRVLNKREDWAGSEVLCRRMLEGKTRVMGPDHPDTLLEMASLAFVLSKRGNCEEAEMLCRRRLDTWTRLRGPEDLETLQAIRNLAHVLFKRGDWDGSEVPYREALLRMSGVPGPEHPEVHKFRFSLGLLLAYKREWPEALELVGQSLAARLAELGAQHRLTLKASRLFEKIKRKFGTSDEGEAKN